jgi:Predicted glycosylase
MKNLFHALLLWVIAAFVVGCGGGGGDAGTTPEVSLSSITVTPSNPTIASGSAQQFTATGTYSDSSQSDITTSVVWSSSNTSVATINSTGLASSLSAGTSTITATVGAVSGDTVLTVTAAAGAARPLAIISAAPTNASAGTPYSFTAVAAGGTPPYVWLAATISPDGLTNGLTLDTATGEISGTPVYTGTTPLIIKVTDANSDFYVAQYELTVTGVGSDKSITNTPPDGVQGAPYAFTYTTDWSAILGCSPNLYGVEGKMPSGLDFNPLSGELTGIPATAGSYAFRLYASSGSTGCSTEPLETNIHTFTMNVAAAALPTSPAGASNWTKSASNPVLTTSASAAEWDSAYVSSPSITKVGTSYYMFYEGGGEATGVRQIGLATSSDGITWTKSEANPVLTPGAAGAWDASSVRYPSVHYDGSVFMLWYRGEGAAGSQIGLATSADGINWTKQASPVFGDYIPGTVIYDGTQYVMWYEDAGSFGSATSADGIAWTDRSYITSPNMTSYTLTRPTVIFDGTSYRMWYLRFSVGSDIYPSALGATYTSSLTGSGLLEMSNATIAYASSADGEDWTFYEGNPVLVMGASGWDSPGVGQPAVIKDGTAYKMWYTGGAIVNGNRVQGAIGYAATP